MPNNYHLSLITNPRSTPPANHPQQLRLTLLTLHPLGTTEQPRTIPLGGAICIRSTSILEKTHATHSHFQPNLPFRELYVDPTPQPLRRIHHKINRTSTRINHTHMSKSTSQDRQSPPSSSHGRSFFVEMPIAAAHIETRWPMSCLGEQSSASSLLKTH